MKKILSFWMALIWLALAAPAQAQLNVSISGELAQVIMAYQAVIWSFAFSFLAIFLMMQWLRHATYLPFVIYRIILGICLLLDAYGVI